MKTHNKALHTYKMTRADAGHFEGEGRRWASKHKLMANLQDKLNQALAKHGVTLCEYEAMICPYYGIYLEPEELASWTVSENRVGCSKGEQLFTEDQYLQAIRQMLDKGWLMIQPGDCRCETLYHRADGVPCREHECIPERGAVGFTRTGYLLHRRILRDGRSKRFMQKVDSFSTVDKSKHEVHFYAQSLDICHDWIHEVQQVFRRDESISQLVDGPAEIVAIRGPHQIGEWSPSRFLTLRRGYHVVVSYKRRNRRRVTMPETGISGWVGRLRPVSVGGSIHSNGFLFGDYASWTDPSLDDRFALFTWQFLVYPVECGGPIYELEEATPGRRKEPLTVMQALHELKQCGKQYLASRTKAPTNG